MHTRALATCAILAAGTATAQEVELSLTHWVPATHPLQTLGMEPWIDIVIYPAQQLGAAPDHYDMARDGIADIGFINPGYQPGRFPIMAAAELPFNFANAKGGVRALTEWYKSYAGEEMADVYFRMAISHDPGTMHGKDPILVPEDIRGKTVRPANATEARFVNLLGGASVQVPAPEMREVLSKGTADITASPWDSLYIFRVEDIVTHHLDVPLYVTTFAFVMNKDRIDALAPEDRAVLDAHCTPEWSERIASPWADAEASGRQKIIDAGHTMYVPTDVEMVLWQDAAAPLADEWKASVSALGVDAEAAYQGLVDKLKERGAYVE